MSFLEDAKKWFLDIYKTPAKVETSGKYAKEVSLEDFFGGKDIEVVNFPDPSQASTIVKASLEPNPNLYRPLTFNDYIGQEKQKGYLQRYIQGAKDRNKKLPHTLIHGPAGCGKTTLAKIIARELGVSFQEILSTRIENISDLLAVFKNANGGVIFLDEIHALDREMVEPLYPIMEDFQFEGMQFEPFTLIGATTEYGEIVENRKPFLDRFKIKIQLEDYSEKDILQIIKKYRENTYPNDKVSEENLWKIASNCRFTPRVAISLLDSTVFLNNDIETTLKSANIIKKGYTKKDLEYMETVSLSPKGIGLNALASSLMTSRKDITEQIEPYLFKNKLVVSTKSGRVISEKGKELIKELTEAVNA